MIERLIATATLFSCLCLNAFADLDKDELIEQYRPFSAMHEGFFRGPLQIVLVQPRPDRKTETPITAFYLNGMLRTEYSVVKHGRHLTCINSMSDKSIFSILKIDSEPFLLQGYHPIVEYQSNPEANFNVDGSFFTALAECRASYLLGTNSLLKTFERPPIAPLASFVAKLILPSSTFSN